MLQHHFHDLHADGEHRVQRSHRLLKDHADLVAANLPHLFPRQLQQIPPFIKDGAANDLARRIRYQPQDAQRRDALSRAGLADQAHDFAWHDVEADAVNSLCHAGFS